MTTGQLIKAARKNAGMTQAELADKLGIPYQSVSQWERDTRNPKYDTLKRIAAVLSVEWTELVPEDKQGTTIAAHIIEKAGLVVKSPNGHSMTDEETALKILLNSIGYDLIKTGGNYFFTYESGGSEISTHDLSELLNCAQNGLKVAAKTLELKLIQEAFDSRYRAEAAPQSPPEDTDTPMDQDSPKGPTSSKESR